MAGNQTKSMDRKFAKNNTGLDTNSTTSPHQGKRGLRDRRPTKREFKFPPPKPKTVKPLQVSSSVENRSNLSENELTRNVSSRHKAVTSLFSLSSGIGTATNSDFSSILRTENGGNGHFSNLAPDFTGGGDNSKVCFNVSPFNPGLLAISEGNEDVGAQTVKKTKRRSVSVKKVGDLSGGSVRLKNKEGKLGVDTCASENRRVQDESDESCAPFAKQNGRLCLQSGDESQSLEIVLWARNKEVEVEEITDLDVALHVINGVIERHKSQNRNKKIVNKFQRKLNCKFKEIIAQNRVEKEWSDLVQSLARADAEKDRLEYELKSTNKLLEAATDHRHKRLKLNSFFNKWQKCAENLRELNNF